MKLIQFSINWRKALQLWSSQKHCAVLLFVVLLSPLLSGGQSKSLYPVTLQLKWDHQFQFAGYYMALHNGYYEEAGLDVKILPGGPSLDVTEQVVSGQADFGTGTSGLLLDYDRGAPVVVLGVIFQHSAQVLIMKTDSFTDIMEDLVGESVMMESDAVDLLAMFYQGGLSPNKLNFIEYACGITNLLKNDHRAFSAYISDEPFLLDQAGIDYLIISPRIYGIDFYGDNFFTRREMLDNNKDVVEGFYAATVRGWKDVLNEPERAIDVILETYEVHKSRAHLVYEAEKTAELMTQLVSPGYMLMGRWEHIADTYVEVGMVGERPDLGRFVFFPRQEGLPEWFWRALGTSSALLLVLSTLTLYLQRLNAKLRTEVVERRLAEERLLSANRSLQIAKQSAEEAYRKKTWFIANVSHDLRAPISSVIGLINIFKHHGRALNLPDKFDRFLEQLSSSGDFLMLMLNNILDLSALEMDAAVLRPERVDLNLFKTDILNLTTPLADAKGIQINLHLTGSRTVISLDRTRLTQILLNLVQNASKFSPANSSIEVTMICDEEQLQLRVQDEGPGIPPEKRSRIFGVFTQEDMKGRDNAGVGLGLSIVQRNAKLMGGAVRIGEVSPRGSCFIVTLPFDDDTEPPLKGA